jgi:hypothetical protein
VKLLVGIRRWLAIFVAAMTLVLLASLGHAAVNPAFACSWNVERTHTNTVQFYSSYLHGYDYLNGEIITYQGQPGTCVGGAQNRYYESYQSTRYGTPGYYFTAARAWVCGTYWGTWSAATNVVYTSVINYPTYCGRQADNYGSYYHDNYGDGNVVAYVNQG